MTASHARARTKPRTTPTGGCNTATETPVKSQAVARITENSRDNTEVYDG